MNPPTPAPSLLARRESYDDAIWTTITRAAPNGAQAAGDPVWRDVFSLLYKINPQRATTPPPGLEREWDALSRLWDSGAVETMRARTRLHALFAWLGAEELTRQVKGLAEQIDEWKRKKLDLGGTGTQALAAVSAVEQRLDDAQAAITQLGLDQDAAGGFGRGTEEGSAPSAKALDQALRFMQSLENQRMLDLFAWLGRLKPLARRARDEHWTNQPRRMVGITSGNEIARQTPLSLMLYTQRPTRRLWMKQQHERSNQQYRLQRRIVEGKGPVILCLDKSGSMRGEKDAWAAAVALQVQELAERDGRDVATIPYHTVAFGRGLRGRGGRVPPGSAPWEPYLFPKGRRDAAQFLELYSMPPDGRGTNTYAALEAAWEVLDRYPVMKDADIVVITDGMGGLIARAAAVQAECRKRQARLWMILTLHSDRTEAQAVTDEERIIEIRSLTSADSNRRLFDRLGSL